MFVLQARENQRIFIGNDIVITLVEISGSRVAIGIDAPKDVPILREKLAPPELVAAHPRPQLRT